MNVYWICSLWSYIPKMLERTSLPRWNRRLVRDTRGGRTKREFASKPSLFIRQPPFQKSFFVRKSQCQMYHLRRTCAVSLSLLSGLAGAMPHFWLEVSFLCKQAMYSWRGWTLHLALGMPGLTQILPLIYFFLSSLFLFLPFFFEDLCPDHTVVNCSVFKDTLERGRSRD